MADLPESLPKVEIDKVGLKLRMDATVTVYDPTLTRFWAKVDKEGPMSALGTRCWVWTAAVNNKGPRAYGIFAVTKKNLVTAHAFSYWLEHGEFLRGIDHRCHNRLCVNPGHLRHLTNKQNIENRGGLNRNNTSGVRGVTWDKRRNRWMAKVMHNRRCYHVGYFSTLEEAQVAVVAKRNELFTHNDADRILS